MVGLIFGIIFILAGIIAGIVLYLKTETKYKYDDNGNPMRDADFNRITVTVHPFRKFTVLVMVVGLILGALVTSFGCIASIDTGYVGIVTTFGKVEDYTFDSGMHFKAPWNSVTQIDNRVQKTTIELPCFSKDIQEVNTIYTVNYQVSKTNAQDLYRDIGIGYLETVVNPTIQESVKTIIARYKADELISNRAGVAGEIEELLKSNLQKYNIDVASTAIENMDFTDSFTQAVEAKVVAEQNKIKAETEQAQELAKAKNDKLIAEENAKANAEVAKIQAEADRAVAEIAANSAEYQGKKDAAIALQRLASINGWTVVHNDETGINELYKANGENVTEDELIAGAERLIEYYYTQAWDGKLPDTFVGDEDVSNIIIGK